MGMLEMLSFLLIQLLPQGFMGIKGCKKSSTFECGCHKLKALQNVNFIYLQKI